MKIKKIILGSLCYIAMSLSYADVGTSAPYPPTLSVSISGEALGKIKNEFAEPAKYRSTEFELEGARKSILLPLKMYQVQDNQLDVLVPIDLSKTLYASNLRYIYPGLTVNWSVTETQFTFTGSSILRCDDLMLDPLKLSPRNEPTSIVISRIFFNNSSTTLKCECKGPACLWQSAEKNYS